MLWNFKLKHITIVLLMAMVLPALQSCSKEAVCPGSGQSKAGDLSPFNSDGTPKSRKGRYRSNGLINKKDPKRLHKR